MKFHSGAERELCSWKMVLKCYYKGYILHNSSLINKNKLDAQQSGIPFLVVAVLSLPES
jgi:hypothetical protein